MIVEVPAHLSWSQVSNLVGGYCPASYFYERVLGKAPIPTWAQIGGSALHKASEDWDHNLISDGTADTSPQYLASLWEPAFEHEIGRVEEHTPFPRSEWRASGRASKAWPNKEDEACWRSKGPEYLFAWATWRLTVSWEIAWFTDPDGKQIPAIEIPIVVTLGGEEVKGYIDRVFSRTGEDGQIEYAVGDLKTSQQEPKDTGQLETYRAGLIDQWGIDARWGFFWMARTGLSTAFTDLSAKPREKTEFLFREAAAARARGAFVHRPSALCAGCPVRDYCAEYGGSKAAETPQPWDVTEVRIAERR